MEHLCASNNRVTAKGEELLWLEGELDYVLKINAYEATDGQRVDTFQEAGSLYSGLK